MSTRYNTNFTPDRTNFGRFSAVSSNSFIQNHCTHNFLFCSFKFFGYKVDAGFFNNLVDVMIFRKRFNSFFNKLFSFFKLILSVFSIKVVICIKNHIMSNFINNIFKFSCIIRVNKFFFNNAASFSKFNLSIALFSYFTLSKLNSFHNIVFSNEFTSSLNHDYTIVSTCNNYI